MPKFTMEDVDRDIEERRAKYRQPKPQEANRSNVLQTLLDRIKRKPGEGEQSL